jgi:D-glycero-alpha-D-manno-heptose 1-phosphate guanylyltransferase
MTENCVILAGGLGTRLRDVVSDLPKVMAPVNGRPFIDYQIDFLKRQKIKWIKLSLGYKHEEVVEHVFHSLRTDIMIDFSIEDEPMGTGGALWMALCEDHEPVFVLNGDSFFEVDLKVMWHIWKTQKPDMVMALKALPDVSRYGSVTLDNNQRVISFEEKGANKGAGLINGGVYLFHPDWFMTKVKQHKFSFEKDILEPAVSTDKIVGVVFDRYFIDIGVPDDYERAQHDFAKR